MPVPTEERYRIGGLVTAYEYPETLPFGDVPEDVTLSRWYLPDGGYVDMCARNSIPPGMYWMRPDFTGRFQYFVIEHPDMIGERKAHVSMAAIRTDIELHRGTRWEHSEGCFMPARWFGRDGPVGSYDAMNDLVRATQRDINDPPIFALLYLPAVQAGGFPIE